MDTQNTLDNLITNQIYSKKDKALEVCYISVNGLMTKKETIVRVPLTDFLATLMKLLNADFLPIIHNIFVTSNIPLGTRIYIPFNQSIHSIYHLRI